MEMLNKFIDEGKREHEEMRAFIYDFQTNNELLFKERNNLLIELRFGVQELLKVIDNVPMIDCDVKGVTSRGGKTTTQDVHDNDTNVLPKELVVVEPEKPVGSNEILTHDQPHMTSKRVVQPSKEQLHINLPFIEALAKMPKYAKFLKGLLTNKATLEEACKIIMNERCSAVLLNKLPSKEKDPGNDAINDEVQELMANKEPGSFLSRGLEKSIDQSGLEYCESTSSNEKNGSDSENSIRRINFINTPYPVTQGTTNGNDVKSEHLYSASANEIDEKKHELKNFPQHLEYAYLHGDKSFPIIISSELSGKEKISLL
ncbi:hypothetical protein Tco_0218210 [Tanacetum coccineum]